MSDDASERPYLPWILATLVLVVGGAKLEAARPLVARVLALAVPVVPVAIALKRVEGGGATLERAAGAVGWLTILTAEACVAGGFLRVEALTALVPGARFVLYGAAAAALVVHTLEARRLGKARFAGYIGIAGGFAVYISKHAGADPFASVFGAFFVGMFVGGAELLSGELLGRVFKKP
jgi:hypothetical protein